MRRARLYVELGLAALSGVALVLTLLWDEWIEAVFGVEPDGGDGSAEWMVFLVLALVLLVSATLARVELRRQAGPRRA